MAQAPTGETTSHTREDASSKRQSGRTDQLGQSFSAALRAVRNAPESEDSWDHVEELADATGRPEEVAAAYREVLDTKLSGTVRTKMSQRAVRFHEEWFGDQPDTIHELLAAIIDRDPDAGWAFDRLTLALTVAERWSDLLELYDRTLRSTTDVAKRRRLLDDAAHVAKDFARSPRRAVDYMQLQLQLEPKNNKLSASIERLLERQERWSDLIELWRSRLNELSAHDARATRLRIAQTLFTNMAEPAMALEELRVVLDESPGYAPACEQLEEILAAENAAVHVRIAALGLLRSNYRAANRPADVVAAVERAIGFAPPEEQLALRREAATRLGILGRDDEALSHYADVLRDAPTDGDARLQARQLAQRSSLHKKHAQALVEAANAADSPVKASLLAEAAGVYRQHLGDNDLAIVLYGEVVELASDDPATGLAAAHQLNELLAAAQRHHERLDALESLANLEPARVVRKAVLGEAGRLAAELDDPKRSLSAYGRRLDEDELDLAALDASIDVLTKHEMWRPLVDALRRRAQTTGVAQQRRADLVQAARIQAERLDAIGDSIDTWLEVREEFGDEHDTITALDELMATALRWPELASILGGAAEVRRNRSAGLLARVGEISHKHLEDLSAATTAFAQTLGVDPQDLTARRGLLRLCEEPQCARQAVDALVGAYKLTDDWKSLLELTEARVRTAAEPRHAVAVLQETATLEENHGGDAARAQRAIERAFVLDPFHPGLEHDLQRLPTKTGNWREAARAFSKAADVSDNEARSADLHRIAGGIHEKQLSDADSAVESYAKAAVLDPSSVETRRSIIRAAAQAGAWPQVCGATVEICAARELVDAEAIASLVASATAHDAWADAIGAMEAAIAVSDLGASLSRELEMLCSTWHLEHLQDVPAALAAAKRAVEHDPEHQGALLLLAHLQRRNPSWSLIETLLRLDALSNRELDELHEAAQVAFDHREDRARSREVIARLYRKAARLLSQGEEVTGVRTAAESALWAVEQMVTLDATAGDARRAAGCLAAASELPIDVDTSLDLKLRSAKLWVEAGDRNAAIELYRYVFAARNDDLALARELAELCEKQDQLLELVATRTRELELTEDIDRRLALRLQISGLVGQLERRGGRVEALLRNLAEHPGHPASVDALAQVLRDKGRHGQLADVITGQAQEVEPTQEVRAAELWLMVAQIAEHDLRDIDRAIDGLTRVARLAPTTTVLDNLATLHLQRDEPAMAAKVLQKQLDATEVGNQVPVMLRLARAQIQANDEPAATVTLQRAFDLAPRSGEVRKLLLRLLRKLEQWDTLANTLSVATEHISDGETILAYAREAAEVYHDRLQEPERAVPVLERAYAIEPDDRKLRSRLAEGLRAASRLDEARALLELTILDYGRRRSPQRAATHLQLARVAHAQGNITDALDQLETASGMDPSDPTILRTLASLAGEDGQYERAERAYRALLLQLRQRSADTTGELGTALVWYELSRIASQRGDTEQAGELIESALGALAERDTEGPALQNVLKQNREFGLLQRVLEARLTYANTATQRAEILGELAEVYEDHLDQPEKALRARLEALHADPGSPVHHDRASELAARLSKQPEYVQTVEELLAKTRRNTEVYVRCELLLRLITSMEHDPAQYDRAEELLSEAEQTGVREADIWRIRARLAGARGDTQSQMVYLEKLASFGESESETRADALYRMAEVYLANPDTTERGVQMMTEALEADPRYARATHVLRSATEGSLDLELLGLFERVARNAQDDQALLLAIERRTAHPEASPAGVREAYDLAMTLGENDRAEALLVRAVELAQTLLDGDQEISWALIALAQRRLSANDLAGAVKWVCQAIEAGEVVETLPVASAIAEATGTDGDLTLPIRVYETLLERDPSVRQIWEPLASLYRQIGDLDRLHRLVDETLDSLDSADERNSLRLELAQSLLRQGDREEQATEVLSEILLESPEHPGAQAIMVGLLERGGKTSELIDLLRNQLMAAQQSGDTEAIVARSLRLADKLAQDDPRDAAATLRDALDLAPNDSSLMMALLDNLSPQDDEEERTELSERLVGVLEGPQAADFARNLAQNYHDKGDKEGELRALIVGYQRAPDDTELRRRLEKAYEEQGDYRGLATMMTNAAADESQPPRARVSLLRQAATIYRDQLSDPNESANILNQAMQVDPDDMEVAIELGDALSSAGRSEEAGALLTSLLKRDSLTDALRLQLLSTRADLHLASNELDPAIADLEAALAYDPASITERLAAALQQQCDLAAATGDLEAEGAATRRLAEVLIMRQDSDRAHELLTAWIARERKDARALHILRTIETERENWEAVVKLCARLVAVETDEAQIEAAMGLAQACQKLGRPKDARAGLEHARRKQPDNPQIRGELIKIYESIGASKELAKLLGQELEHVEDPEQRLPSLQRAVALHVEVGDFQAALPMATELLVLSPGDVEATTVLADVLIGLGQLDQADEVLDTAIETTKGRRTTDAGVLYHRKAAVAAAANDTQRQLEFLQQAFACDKNNGEIAADLADLAQATEQWELATRVLRAIMLMESPCRISKTDSLLRQAKIAYQRGDRQRAVLWARKARMEDPEDPGVIEFLTELGES